MTRSLLLLALFGTLAFASPRVADAQSAEEQDGDVQTRAEILRKEREAKQGELEPYEISSAEARLLRIQKANFPRNIFVRGWNQFRPLIGGMPSGSGFVVGPGFVNGLDRESFDFEANARVSTRGFSTFDARVNFPTERSGAPVLAYARAEARNLTELRFFGLGQDSLAANRVTYELKDRTFETGLRAQLGRFVEIFGRGAILVAEVRGGTGDRPIFEVFPPDVVPGFGEHTNYVVYGGDVTVDLRDEGFPPVGVVFKVGAHRYEDTTTDRFDFDHVVGEVRGHIPLGHRNRRLALRVRSAHSMGRGDGEVPFYLMEALGGGSTLRGFREFRFREPRNILINAEYRWEVWTYLDFTLFYDAGKVFSDIDQLNFDGLESAYGFGIRTHAPGGFLLRMDLASSSEGFRFHIGSGPSF